MSTEEKQTRALTANEDKAYKHTSYHDFEIKKGQQE